MYFCFLFYSRNNALRFLEELKRADIEACLINTPDEIKKGCGLSVKTLDLNSAKNILSFKTYSSFYGILKAEQTQNGIFYTRLH